MLRAPRAPIMARRRFCSSLFPRRGRQKSAEPAPPRRGRSAIFILQSPKAIAPSRRKSMPQGPTTGRRRDDFFGFFRPDVRHVNSCIYRHLRTGAFAPPRPPRICFSPVLCYTMAVPGEVGCGDSPPEVSPLLACAVVAKVWMLQAKARGPCNGASAG